MNHNRSIPPVTVTPVLTYPSVRGAVEWLSNAFGFVERTRIGENHRSQMSIGSDGAVIIADVGPERHAPQEGVVCHLIKVRVENLDEVFARARSSGARVLQEPIEHDYGERECIVEDLAGHRWNFSETVRDVAPEEIGCRTILPWPGQPSD
jgi:uncharacterized glyoxalase superfamily protein PhnB